MVAFFHDRWPGDMPVEMTFSHSHDPLRTSIIVRITPKLEAI